MKKKLTKIFCVLGWILLFLLLELGLLFDKTRIWALQTVGGVSMEEIVFHLKVPLQGTDTSTIYSFLQQALLPSLVQFLFVFLFFFVLPRWERKIRQRQEKKRKKKIVVRSRLKYLDRKNAYITWKAPTWCLGLISLTIFLWNGYKICEQYSVGDYLIQQMSPSTWIKEQYVEPKDSLLSWPQKKRNLIYIYLESMEATYASIEDGGAFDEDLIPELTALAKENVSFSSSEKPIGGGVAFTYTNWTIGGMFAQTTGLPLKIPVDGNSMGEYATFLPGVTSLGELLEKEGYHNCLMIGSDAAFGGRKNYFEQHGDYEILDYNWALETGVIPEGYHVFWGMEDERLIGAVKDKLTELASSEEPFNLTMLTADTHFPDGYRCDLCEYQHDSDYKDALSCSSRQIADLVKWIQNQDFYDNTTIAISGDHFSMSAEIGNEVEYGDRHVYNCIINPVIEPIKKYNRLFSTMDMFPTTLAAMGVKIKDERLGLGTNLFSDTQTLVEEFGASYVEDEIKKNSEFYNKTFIYCK